MGDEARFGVLAVGELEQFVARERRLNAGNRLRVLQSVSPPNSVCRQVQEAIF